MIKKLAILTSGGDAPGMNPAIRAIVKEAQVNNIEAFLVFDGYQGLYENKIKPANAIDVNSIIGQGGTAIGSARFPVFKDLAVRKQAQANLQKHAIDALVVIGGDGSYMGAQLLHELGVKTIALPGTIDNDITSSDFTIGYDTALNTIVENLERVRDTMRSHNRCGIIEVMGHGCGDLALFSAMATGAEIVVTNENIIEPKTLGQIVQAQSDKGKRGIVIIVSECIYPDLNQVARIVEAESGLVTRALSLQHVQRGGVPTAQERINAARMGRRAIKLLLENESGVAVGILSGHTHATPILEALALPRENRKELAEGINKMNQA